MLVAFYNTKALGVRYLEGALRRAGYGVRTVFYQGFNSRCPAQTTRRELDLLCEQVEKAKPFLIGLSVMSSMYLETVNRVLDALQEKTSPPLVCGGAFASLFPDYFLDRRVDYVIRGDGEIPICRLADPADGRGACGRHPLPQLLAGGGEGPRPYGRGAAGD